MGKEALKEEVKAFRKKLRYDYDVPKDLPRRFYLDLMKRPRWEWGDLIAAESEGEEERTLAILADLYDLHSPSDLQQSRKKLIESFTDNTHANFEVAEAWLLEDKNALSQHGLKKCAGYDKLGLKFFELIHAAMEDIEAAEDNIRLQNLMDSVNR